MCTYYIDPPRIDVLLAAWASSDADVGRPAASMYVAFVLPLGLDAFFEQVEGCIWKQASWGSDVVVKAACSEVSSLSCLSNAFILVTYRFVSAALVCIRIYTASLMTLRHKLLEVS